MLQAWFGGRAYERHRHDTYTIGVTEAGIQAFDYRGAGERCGPGDAFVLHPDEPHDGRAGAAGGFGYRTVYVDPLRIAAAAQAICGRSTPLPFVPEPVSHNPTLLRAVADAFRAPAEPLALDTLILQLAQGLLEAAGMERTAGLPRHCDTTALARARAYLESRHDVVRSAALETVTGLSRYELARQFRAFYGTSPYRYSLLRRLDFAREQVRDGLPLVEVALAAGFADQAHFTRTFRSAFGLTPARYGRLYAAGVIETAPA